MDSNTDKSDESLKRKSETDSEMTAKQAKPSEEDFEDEGFGPTHTVSRWERMEASEAKLDRLDSYKMKTKPTFDDYLQVTHRLRDGQKGVRWADVEERKRQEHSSQIGFVVGQQNWQYLDDQRCQRALTQVTYF
ncbi:unnamed protein product [Oppiella nova]|uniref:Uncharacterized protein n=1 Tax=Oppiella nova TaxID=334625 RepID=A0A7R9MSS9_9ACAR|nr:unnamed protein product [Oppiella nova]CAG2182981.1 unnamed protein product [Oppiella nova]